MDFSNDASVCTTLDARPKYSIHESVDVADLKKYLARPVLLVSSSFGLSPSISAAVDFNFAPGDLRNIFGSVNWDRLTGAVGIRATLKFIVTINKTAFHQGIVALTWDYASVGNLTRNAWVPLSLNVMHTRLNLADSTMGELSVPYVSHLEYWPIPQYLSTHVTDGTPYGRFALVNLTGCPVVAGQDSPRYNVYVCMEDVELVGAVPYNLQFVTAQSGLTTGPTGVSKSIPLTGKRDSQRAEAKEVGAISQGLAMMSKGAGRVANSFNPMGIFGNASWLIDIASGVARAFGYSKPLDQEVPRRIIRNSYAGESNIDTPFAGFAVSPFQGNTLAFSNAIGGSNVDEMSFDYILSKYSYIYRGRLSTTSTLGDAIYSTDICPTNFWFRDFSAPAAPTGNIALKVSNTITENAFLPSTLCYVGDNFRYWRGAYRFRFSFAKTKLHGGRVQVTYVPNVPSRNLNAPLTNLRVAPANISLLGPDVTGYSTIFDLQDANEFEFDVPYICNEPYMETRGSTGALVMQVVAPLAANVSVPATVNFMVEVKALPGFEFAVIKSSLMTGIARTGTAAISFQSGLASAVTTEDTSQYAIGERVTSAKQMIMMPDYYKFELNTNNGFSLTPQLWFVDAPLSLATPSPTNERRVYFASKSSRFAQLFTFVNGGTHVTISRDNDVGRVDVAARYVPEAGGLGAGTNGSFWDESLNTYSSTYLYEQRESGKFKFPLYSRFMRLPRDYFVALWNDGFARVDLTSFQDVANYLMIAYPRLEGKTQAGTQTRYVVGTAAADDATMALFRGPPPCTVLNILATENPVAGLHTAIA